jgi:hypothetical protein
MGEHVAGIGVMRMHTEFWLENMNGKDQSEDIGIDGKIILEWMWRK